jgi:hypothetical protein
VVGQWQLAHHQTEDIRRIIARLREATTPGDGGLALTNPYLCAQLLVSELKVLERSSAASTHVAALDSLARAGPAVGDAASYMNIAVARLYARLGDPERALEAIRRRPYMTGWPRYLASSLREEGALAELVGDSTGAVRAFTAYLKLRKSPDPAIAGEVEAVRRALDLTAGPAVLPR